MCRDCHSCRTFSHLRKKCEMESSMAQNEQSGDCFILIVCKYLLHGTNLYMILKANDWSFVSLVVLYGIEWMEGQSNGLCALLVPKSFFQLSSLEKGVLFPPIHSAYSCLGLVARMSILPSLIRHS